MATSNFNGKLYNSLKTYSKTHNLGWDRFNQQLTPDELIRNMTLAVDPLKVKDAADGPGAVLFAIEWSIETGRMPIGQLQALAKANGAEIARMFDTVLAKADGRSQRALLEQVNTFKFKTPPTKAPLTQKRMKTTRL